jgi:hypothetical protein
MATRIGLHFNTTQCFQRSAAQRHAGDGGSVGLVIARTPPLPTRASKQWQYGSMAALGKSQPPRVIPSNAAEIANTYGD